MVCRDMVILYLENSGLIGAKWRARGYVALYLALRILRNSSPATSGNDSPILLHNDKGGYACIGEEVTMFMPLSLRLGGVTYKLATRKVLRSLITCYIKPARQLLILFLIFERNGQPGHFS